MQATIPIVTPRTPTLVIQVSRLTCVGMQYTVADPAFVQVVTVNGEQITCTCGSPVCAHIQAVRERQARKAEADARRDAYCALFDLGYLE